MRVARETYVLLARFRVDSVKQQKGGSRQAPPFLLLMLTFESVFRRRFAMMVVALATAVFAIVSIMRGCLVGRLRLKRVRRIEGRRLHGSSLLHGHKKRQRGRQQEESNESFHGNSPQRNPL